MKNCPACQETLDFGFCLGVKIDMVQKLSEPVSVYYSYNHNRSLVDLHWVVWKGRMHRIKKIGLHHTYRKGRNLYHVFSAVSDTLFFRLVLDTESLTWKLEEISDGLPD